MIQKMKFSCSYWRQSKRVGLLLSSVCRLDINTDKLFEKEGVFFFYSYLNYLGNAKSL